MTLKLKLTLKLPLNLCVAWNHQILHYTRLHYCGTWSFSVGQGVSVVSLVSYVRMVNGSIPPPATTYRPWASRSLTVACSASACSPQHTINAVIGSASK